MPKRVSVYIDGDFESAIKHVGTANKEVYSIMFQGRKSYALKQVATAHEIFSKKQLKWLK